MADVFLVDGSIEDGMQGIPFTLGVFNNEELANQRILELLQSCNCEYTIENGMFCINLKN